MEPAASQHATATNVSSDEILKTHLFGHGTALCDFFICNTIEELLLTYLLTYLLITLGYLTQCQTSIKRAFASTMVEIFVVHYFITNACNFSLYDMYICFAERPYNLMLQVAPMGVNIDPRAGAKLRRRGNLGILCMLCKRNVRLRTWAFPEIPG